jgi:branched-chain amino acid transport system substrate-binding protein
VPIKPATPDVSPVVAQVVGFNPDAIIFSAPGADCWYMVAGLGRAGWTNDEIPLVLSAACIDFDAMAAAGDLAKGIYFVGAAGAVLNPLDSITNPRDRAEAAFYQTKPLEYGVPDTESRKGFATQAASGTMTLWRLASQIAVSGQEVTGEAIANAFAATDNDHSFGGTPLSCATAPAPYVAVCNATVTANQWDGEKFVPVRSRFSGLDLVAGTALKPAG